MKLRCRAALLADGWAEDVLIEVAADGTIAAVRPAGNDARDGAAQERVDGYVVAGMSNVHSHAFQRAMAGRTEARRHPTDTFWTWRELMYRFAGRVTPEDLQAIAAALYVEMLKSGFTAVGEFHYLHHDTAGRPFAARTIMSDAIVAAARTAGIALTHLPVLYAHAGFGGKPPLPGQARFVNDLDSYRTLRSDLQRQYGHVADVTLGVAFHSLRAVDPMLMEAVLQDLYATTPIHIHVAEQVQEVEDCVAWSGQRPVAWLLDHMPVDARWCLVHATHLDDRELQGLAGRGPIVGVCPTSEANLGDGVFRAAEYLAGGGALAIGTDSHIGVDLAAELRLLEYTQRLTLRQRAVLATANEPSPGKRLHAETARSGARALGRGAGRIEAGLRADLVVLDPEHPILQERDQDDVLDAWVFAGGAQCVRHVMVGGTWRIRDRRHAAEDVVAARARAAERRLLA